MKTLGIILVSLLVSLLVIQLFGLTGCSTGESENQKIQLVRDRNIEAVKTVLRLLEEEKIEEMINMYAQDAKQVHPFHSGLFPAEISGKKNLHEFIKQVPGFFDEMKFPIEEILPFADPNKIAVKFKGIIKLKNNAGYYRNDYLSIITFDEQGKVKECREYFNPVIAARELGMLDKICNPGEAEAGQQKKGR